MASRPGGKAAVEFPEAATAPCCVTALTADLKTTLARRVRKLRLSRKMNQRELAEVANMRQALISQVERAEANPTLDSIARIAVALKVRVADLFE
jgi:ribosome-binding protein aMBF1 (putative translation factor)